MRASCTSKQGLGRGRNLIGIVQQRRNKKRNSVCVARFGTGIDARRNVQQNLSLWAYVDTADLSVFLPSDALDVPVIWARLSVIAAFATNPCYAKLQRIICRRLRSNLRSVFSGVVSEQRFDVPARVISTLIDGLWLQKAANDAPARDDVVPLVLATVTAQVSDSERLRLQNA